MAPRGTPYSQLSEREKEVSRGTVRRYAAKNRAKLNERARTYRKEAPEAVAASKRNARARLKATNPAKLIWAETKKRAKKRGIPFDLQVSDIVIPDLCPILGIPLEFGVGRVHDGSPSLDRLIPSRGYVSGNVCIISSKANRMKQDNTLEDLLKLVNYLKERIK